jgi:hypothetical protein
LLGVHFVEFLDKLLKLFVEQELHESNLIKAVSHKNMESKFHDSVVIYSAFACASFDGKFDLSRWSKSSPALRG